MEEVFLRQGLSPEDIPILLKWANSGGEAFLRQFAGPKWRYPLTEDQLAAEDGIHSIYFTGAFAGIIQRFPRRERGIHVGRFLIDPDRRGEGIGPKALGLFCRGIFGEDGVDTISLNVYLDNAPARRCYEKCGFRAVRVNPEWNNCRMELSRERQGNPMAALEEGD